MAHLRLTTGRASGTRYPLEQPKIVLGRHPDCDIVTDSSAVSRYHAKITGRDDGIYIEDIDSRNGTFVNEQRVEQPRRLRCDDVVRICDLIFVFHDEVTQGQILASGRDSTLLVDDERDKSSIRKTLDVSSRYSGDSISVNATVKLKAMVDLATQLGKAVGIEPVLSTLLDTLFHLFKQADRGFIVFRTADGHLVPKCAKFRKETGESARISRTIINFAIDEKKAIISADAADDERFDLTESIANFQIRSLMCSPLMTSDDEIVGAIHIDTVDPARAFDEADLELFWAIASQGALAIQNAELLEQALEKRVLQRDLELANQVQLGLLPQKRPETSNFEFFDYYRAAKHIGGDYYDYIRLPGDRIAVIVADVSGHGAAAALLMTKLAAEARFCLATFDRPADVVNRLNKLLCDDGVEDRFVTMVMIILKTASAELTVVNAGHFAPLCSDQNGNLTELAPEIAGIPLGVNEDFEYQQEDVKISNGDVVVLYTDGIVEAMNPEGEQFGRERFRKRMTSTHPSLDELGAQLIDDVKRFADQQPQSDDICLVCVRHT
jgi:sigma-B regulation protein RsbU (phosphoserine phosphatase)